MTKAPSPSPASTARPPVVYQVDDEGHLQGAPREAHVTTPAADDLLRIFLRQARRGGEQGREERGEEAGCEAHSFILSEEGPEMERIARVGLQRPLPARNGVAWVARSLPVGPTRSLK